MDPQYSNVLSPMQFGKGTGLDGPLGSYGNPVTMGAGVGGYPTGGSNGIV